MAALILVGGSLGDHYGRRRIFALGVVLFAAPSVWCGLAVSPEQLIVARAVQGVGGALLVPGSLICGHVGCCDSSRSKHATGHPLVQAFPPGEGWIWCYVDRLVLEPR